METATTTAPEGLPPGVNQVGAPPAATAPVNTQTAAAPPPAAFDDGGQVNDAANWDWLKILGWITLGTLSLMALNYFRERTYMATKDSKEKDKKIKEIQSAVSEIKQEIQQY